MESCTVLLKQITESYLLLLDNSKQWRVVSPRSKLPSDKRKTRIGLHVNNAR